MSIPQCVSRYRPASVGRYGKAAMAVAVGFELMVDFTADILGQRQESPLVKLGVAT